MSYTAKIRLYDETELDLLRPDPAKIAIPHIAIALSREGRYANQGLLVYTVAEHSYLVAAGCYSFARDVFDKDQETFRLLQLRALFHDSAEAYLRDLPGPLKKLPAMAFYREMEDELRCAIFEHIGIPVRDEVADSYIDLVDKAIREEEMAVLWRKKSTSSVPLGVACVREYEAKRRFMEAYKTIQDPRRFGSYMPFRGFHGNGELIR